MDEKDASPGLSLRAAATGFLAFVITDDLSMPPASALACDSEDNVDVEEDESCRSRCRVSAPGCIEGAEAPIGFASRLAGPSICRTVAAPPPLFGCGCDCFAVSVGCVCACSALANASVGVMRDGAEPPVVEVAEVHVEVDVVLAKWAPRPGRVLEPLKVSSGGGGGGFASTFMFTEPTPVALAISISVTGGAGRSRSRSLAALCEAKEGADAAAICTAAFAGALESTHSDCDCAGGAVAMIAAFAFVFVEHCLGF